jgi:hypothetical protein
VVLAADLFLVLGALVEAVQVVQQVPGALRRQQILAVAVAVVAIRQRKQVVMAGLEL